VEVEEGRTGTLSFGAGYSSVDKFVGFLEVSKDNFDLTDRWSFTGKGQKAHARIEYGNSRKNYEVGWSDHWFNDNLDDTISKSPEIPLHLGFNLYRLTREPDDYKIERTGGNVRLGRRFGIYNRGYVKYQVEKIKIYDIDPVNAPSDVITDGEKDEIQSSLTFDFVRNTTDHPRWPTQNYILKFTTEISGGFLGGDVDFFKNELSYSYFIPAFQTKLGRQVIALNGFYGTIDNIFNNQDIPAYEKYFLGGANTVRGYNERSIKFYNTQLSESYGAKSEAYFNAEYRIPLVKDTIGMVLFYDGGNIFKGSLSFDDKNWKYGYGFGFRIRTPMGDLRLDWGRRINETYEGAGDKGITEIHFNIGNMF
jgi:outer membrane protein insertion porin family